MQIKTYVSCQNKMYIGNKSELGINSVNPADKLYSSCKLNFEIPTNLSQETEKGFKRRESRSSIAAIVPQGWRIKFGQLSVLWNHPSKKVPRASLCHRRSDRAYKAANVLNYRCVSWHRFVNSCATLIALPSLASTFTSWMSQDSGHELLRAPDATSTVTHWCWGVKDNMTIEIHTNNVVFSALLSLWEMNKKRYSNSSKKKSSVTIKSHVKTSHAIWIIDSSAFEKSRHTLCPSGAHLPGVM